MLGDNMYGGKAHAITSRSSRFRTSRCSIGGVKFYAALGNHDSPNQRMYKLFNMNGERYYTFRPKPGVRFFALDSNYMDRPQLRGSRRSWRRADPTGRSRFSIIRSIRRAARHGSDTALRDQLEPLFLKYGVDVVLAGHEHFYERMKPQKGIHYFISGGAAKLRKGDVGGELTEKAFDTGYHFMIFEIDDDKLHFQAISDQGKTVDSGIIQRRRVDDKAAPSVPAAPSTKPVPPQDKPTTSTSRQALQLALRRRTSTAKPGAKPQARASRA